MSINAGEVHNWRLRQGSTTTVFDYLEVWYNRQRRHSSLGYRTPAEYEEQLALTREGSLNPVSITAGEVHMATGQKIILIVVALAISLLFGLRTGTVYKFFEVTKPGEPQTGNTILTLYGDTIVLSSERLGAFGFLLPLGEYRFQAIGAVVLWQASALWYCVVRMPGLLFNNFIGRLRRCLTQA